MPPTYWSMAIGHPPPSVKFRHLYNPPIIRQQECEQYGTCQELLRDYIHVQ